MLHLSHEEKTINGFTIIELFIVIVVIAILAAISVVAYTGIQTRARESQIMNDFSNAAKQLQIYHIDNGRFPGTSEIDNMDIRMSVPNTASVSILACLNNSNGGAFEIYARMESDTSRQFKVTNQSSPEELSSPLSWGTAICTGSTPNAIWGSGWVAS